MLLSGLDLLPSPPLLILLFWRQFLVTLNSRFLPNECWGFRDVWTKPGLSGYLFHWYCSCFLLPQTKKNNVHGQTVAFPDIYMS